jgi:uracil-DNA glycosylase
VIAVAVPVIGSLQSWRTSARNLLRESVLPEDVFWHVEGETPGLFATSFVENHSSAPSAPLQVPSGFLDLAAEAVCHSDQDRFSLLYRVLWRLQDDRNLLEKSNDPQVAKLMHMQKSVHRDCHKMKAFVRFKEIDVASEKRVFAAWFEPDHNIVERTAPFFERRFADMNWTICTPLLTARYHNGNLAVDKTIEFERGLKDATDALWRTYFSNIFNPARLKVAAMKREMPVRYWKNLPEADLIPDLIATASARTADMQHSPPSVPPTRAARIAANMTRRSSQNQPIGSMEALQHDLLTCKGCPLHLNATQTVRGEGPRGADICFVGEQPGDKEDLAGRPFVGPAGQLLDECLAEAGIDRSRAYLTNAVKHFKFEPRGKIRLHKKPNAGEVTACQWWLQKELELVQPNLIVALGATAALALTGRGDAVQQRRGAIEHVPGPAPVFITVHPSSLLRLPPNMKDAAKADFVADLKAVLELSRADFSTIGTSVGQ